MPVEPTLLIDLIYKASKKRGMLLPQITRLVKLMYLTELEYFRDYGERLTELKWKFYLYGPYPVALNSVLGPAEIEQNEWKTGKSSKHIVRDEELFMRATADRHLEGIIDSLVKEWGDADLNQLLDYVYFETEPMQRARRGDDLDFSSVRPPQASRRIVLDSKKLRELRKAVAERAEAYGGLRRTSTPSAELEAGLKAWDEEERTLFPSGPCKVLLDDLVPEE